MAHELLKLSSLCTAALKIEPLPTARVTKPPPPPPLIGQKPCLASLLNLPTPAHKPPVLPKPFPLDTQNKNPQENHKSQIVNLSDHNLTSSETAVLEKGLTFCPSTRLDHFATVKDVLSFTRNLRIKHFFDNLPATNNSDGNQVHTALTKFVPPSNWDPPPLPPAHPLEQFISFLLINVSDPDFTKSLPTKSNTPQSERKAIQNLQNNKEIVILPADKGNTTVILNKTDYVLEANRKLQDTDTYQLLKTDPTSDFCNQIQHFVASQGALQGLSEKSINLLTPVTPTTPAFYLLPKIHKEQRPPPGRPIVSGCGGPTERISALVDTHLQPFVHQLQSYIKDTSHFLERLKSLGTIPKDAFLTTIDVTSLYTNIPQTTGLSSIEFYLNQRPANTKPSTAFLIELARLTLTRNNFRFLDRHYLQVRGTAMGTRMAPSYANLFMGRLEQNFLKTQEIQPLCWWRFIDDIFMIWTNTEEQLIQFLDNLNSYSSLKFTWAYSKSHAVFLDVELTLHEGEIRTTVHTKPTNILQYLHFESYHPFETKKSLPFSLTVRARRICSTQDDLNRQCELIATSLQKRGYPKSLVNRQINQAISANEPKSKPNSTDIPLVVPYHEGLNKLRTLLTSGYKILNASPLTSNLFSRPPRLVYRKPPNLRNKLVRPKFNPENFNSEPTSAPRGSHPCNTPRCRSCAIHKPSTEFNSRLTNRTYPIPGHYTCSSENLIYQLQCKHCNAEYIGLTTNTLRQRMNGHRADTKKAIAGAIDDLHEKPVAAHAVSHNQDFDSCYNTRVVRALPPSNSSELRRWELAHQYITKSRQPPGLNIR